MKPTLVFPSPKRKLITISIAAPETVTAGKPLPAILFMDGDDQFRFAVAAYQELNATEFITPLLLVGVGYGASYTKPANQRMRDYTPTTMPGEAGTGAGDAFLRFLQNSLWSELERRYPLCNDTRGIAGHSLGSLLALYALFQPQPFFNRALISMTERTTVEWRDETSQLSRMKIPPNSAMAGSADVGTVYLDDRARTIRSLGE